MRSFSWVALVLAIATLPGTPARAGDAWCQEFEEGKSAALREGKDLLIDFGGSDWCGPCKWLKERIFSRPDFVEPARRVFVLVDIDLPLRSPIAADRKERYEKLQERYAIQTFPSVLLATPDGRPYARTTYIPTINDPGLYWDHLQALRGRGERLKKSLARADKLEGKAKAEALVGGLSEIYPGLVPLFYEDRVKELRDLDPSDSTGYLSFLDGRKQVDALKAELNRPDSKDTVDAGKVDAVITQSKLRGESLQEALVLRATVQTLADRPVEALDSFKAILAAQATRTQFDRGDYLPLEASSILKIAKRIAQSEADPKSRLAQYFALHRIFQFELPDPYEWSCGEGFRPFVLVREPIGVRYGMALIESTEGLRGEDRARALGRGLDGTMFLCRGPIRTIVLQLIPELVGTDAAKDYVAGENPFDPGRPWYKLWLAH